jgi:hypothetical protein
MFVSISGNSSPALMNAPENWLIAVNKRKRSGKALIIQFAN